jgi:hypothetical protein
MGVFCEMFDDSAIKEKLKGVKSLLMLSCPGCANECLSYAKGIPNRLISCEGKNMEEVNAALRIEGERWASIFKEMGIVAEQHIIAFPCLLFETEIDLIQKSAAGKDAVAVLACSSGFFGIKDILKDFHGKFIPMMKTSGMRAFKLLKDKNNSDYNIVDRESAHITRFKDSHI